MIYRTLLLAVLLCNSLSASVASGQPPTTAAPHWQYQVLERAPHHPETFTQGLELHAGWLYESSGHYGRSFISRYRAADNSQRQQQALPDNRFAEGLTRVGDVIYLLSWRAGVAWELDAESFALKATHHYSGEGWGLAYDGEHLIMSDGSAHLRFYQPHNFQLTGSRAVTLDGQNLDKLNELEYAQGRLWANRWYSDVIYAIAPSSGQVIGQVDLSALRADAGVNRRREAVLNGIAYDPDREGYWVTGKYWPYRYLIRINEQPDSD